MQWTGFPEYCEQAIFGSLIEPLNAISSLGFFIVSFLLLRSFGCVRQIRGTVIPLVISTALVGIGSLSWHTARHIGTFLLDAIPIWVLFAIFFYHLAEIVFGRKFAFVAGAAFAVVQFVVFLIFPVTFLNGAIPYLFGFLLFVTMTVGYFQRRPDADKGLIWSVAIFGVSILFRSIDRNVCTWIPFGTHFLWHIGSAASVYFGIRAILNTKLASPQVSRHSVSRLMDSDVNGSNSLD